MSFLRKLKLFFVLPPKPPLDKEVEYKRKIAAQKIVKLMSSGNVLLQQGRYITKNDVVAKKHKLANYKFS